MTTTPPNSGAGHSGPPTPSPSLENPASGAALLRRLGLTAVLIAACARVVTSSDPLPGWSLDPLTTVAPQNGLGPAGSILLSSLSFLGLTLILAAARRARERTTAVLLALAAIGLVPIAYHGWLGPTACVENATTGLAWAGAIAGALAACIACRHAAERGLVIACLAGLAGPLVIRAGIQVYVEHPVLVADFEANREAFLASHGWRPDSAMARSFERRLSQPDASAWFAMSNVYASVMAGCVAVFAAACLDAARARLWTTGHRNDLYCVAGVAAGLGCSLAGLFIALPAGGAIPKGAAAAMLLGLALLAIGVWWSSRESSARLQERGAGFPARVLRARLSNLLGPALLALALLAVLLRGFVGERLGELSLLFRFYYLEAALRIFADHPLWGTGPDGFQSAYLLAKNPLNPEEVSSPHSVLFDYLSMLGIWGLAWGGMLVALAARAGTALLAHPDGPLSPGLEQPPKSPPPPASASPAPVGWLIAVIAISAAISFARETLPLAEAVPEAYTLLLLDGLTKLAVWALLWLGLAAALLPRGGGGLSPRLTLGLAAGALAVLTHAQIDLTATDVSSSAWALLLLGAAAGSMPLACARRSTAQASEGAAVGGRRVVGACAVACGGLLTLATLAAALPIRAWQAELRETAVLAGESTAFIQRAGALADNPADSLQAFAADLAAATGRPAPDSTERLDEMLSAFRLARGAEAADRLDALARGRATPSRSVAHAAVELRLALTDLHRQLGLAPDPPATPAIDLAAWAARRWPEDPRAWRDLAQANRLAAQLGAGGPEGDLDPLLRAAALDPLSPHLAHQLAERFSELGQPEAARHWATIAVANHEFRRLDPLAGLSENQVRRLRELLGNP